jgi:phosphopantothenoylcysteine decarboxylase/phosphopantothenate--cysteine ligase
MGRALCEAAAHFGHDPVVITGPVQIDYPAAVEIVSVTSTEELLAACSERFPTCDGVIGAAAPCDYRPIRIETQKIAKTGDPLHLDLIETPDVMATLGAQKRPDQWLVGFALETEDQRFRALTKLVKKSCDLMVLNGPQAMDALDNQIEILNAAGELVAAAQGSKVDVALRILEIVDEQLVGSRK